MQTVTDIALGISLDNKKAKSSIKETKGDIKSIGDEAKSQSNNIENGSTGLFDKLGDKKETLSKAREGISKVTESVRKVGLESGPSGELISAFFAILGAATSPIGLLTAAIGVAITVFTVLSNSSKQNKEDLDKLNESIMSITQNIADESLTLQEAQGRQDKYTIALAARIQKEKELIDLKQQLAKLALAKWEIDEAKNLKDLNHEMEIMNATLAGYDQTQSEKIKAAILERHPEYKKVIEDRLKLKIQISEKELEHDKLILDAQGINLKEKVAKDTKIIKDGIEAQNIEYQKQLELGAITAEGIQKNLDIIRDSNIAMWNAEAEANQKLTDQYVQNIQSIESSAQSFFSIMADGWKQNATASSIFDNMLNKIKSSVIDLALQLAVSGVAKLLFGFNPVGIVGSIFGALGFAEGTNKVPAFAGMHYFANGTDSVPAMLTPQESVINRMSTITNPETVSLLQNSKNGQFDKLLNLVADGINNNGGGDTIILSGNVLQNEFIDNISIPQTVKTMKKNIRSAAGLDN